ncbi:MAG: hypothetical protein JWL65_7656 [Gammaproteobacteria bacterium]|nr:hypothetical protein [Gammaproteobacteria bacterium]
MDAGEACDEMDWRCDPCGGVSTTSRGRGRGDSGYNAHCSDHARSNIRKIATAQPACEPGAPAAFESGPLSKARDVLDTGKGADAGGALELTLDEAR